MSVEIPSIKSMSLTGMEESSKDGVLRCPNCLSILVGVVFPKGKTTQDVSGPSRKSVPVTTLSSYFQGCSISWTDEDRVVLDYLKNSVVKYGRPERMLPSYRRAECDENKMLIEQHMQKLLNPL